MSSILALNCCRLLGGLVDGVKICSKTKLSTNNPANKATTDEHCCQSSPIIIPQTSLLISPQSETKPDLTLLKFRRAWCKWRLQRWISIGYPLPNFLLWPLLIQCDSWHYNATAIDPTTGPRTSWGSWPLPRTWAKFSLRDLADVLGKPSIEDPSQLLPKHKPKRQLCKTRIKLTLCIVEHKRMQKSSETIELKLILHILKKQENQ